MLVAGPNLTIDRTIRLAELRPGEVVRATDVDLAPGGKGVNVVKFAALLGRPAELVAFLPAGRTGAVVETWLGEAGVVLHAVPIPGEVRSAAIMLEDSGRTTVLNEPGPAAHEGRLGVLRRGRGAAAGRAPGARLLGQHAAGQPRRRLRAPGRARIGGRRHLDRRRQRRRARACASKRGRIWSRRTSPRPRRSSPAPGSIWSNPTERTSPHGLGGRHASSWSAAPGPRSSRPAPPASPSPPPTGALVRRARGRGPQRRGGRGRARGRPRRRPGGGRAARRGDQGGHRRRSGQRGAAGARAGSIPPGRPSCA